MEYTNIISLVPQGEHFDPTAMNEGVWLTETHIGAIENKLASGATASTAMADAAVAQANEIVSLTDQLNASRQVITERDATIAAQAAEIAKLKAGPAAEPKTTKKEGDDLNGPATEEVSEITIQAAKLRAMRDN
jgi:hypothetical protein